MKFQITSLNKFCNQLTKLFISLSKKYDKSSSWLKALILLALMFIFIHRYNQENPSVEGFTQMKKFELIKIMRIKNNKYQLIIYDSFIYLPFILIQYFNL